MILEAKNISVYYDRAQVLNKVSLEVDEGEVVSLVGANGAGKSTFVRCIAGLLKWQRDAWRGTRLSYITIDGTVTYNGERIDQLPAHEIPKRGLVFCPEQGRPYREMTVEDNLKVHGFFCDKQTVQRNLELVYSLFPVLKERRTQVAGTLSGGERTMLAIGRALIPDAKLLVLDEPSSGLAPIIKDDLFKRISEIHQLGMTVLLVEQDVSYAFETASRNYVLSSGSIVAQGTASQLMADEFIQKTYLGI